MPRKFGQHFLKDPFILHEIVTEIADLPGDRIVEIGPGRGALTQHLMALSRPVSAIEIDGRLLASLRCRFAALDLHHSDVLDFDFSCLAESSLLIVGNLPYEIASPLLDKLMTESRMQHAYFMFQDEFAKRMSATLGAKDYGRLAIMLSSCFEVDYRQRVSPEAFQPPPRVQSALVAMHRRSTPLCQQLPRLQQLLRKAFCQRRKMLRHIFKDEAVDWQTLAIDPAWRPENVPVSAWMRWADMPESGFEPPTY